MKDPTEVFSSLTDPTKEFGGPYKNPDSRARLNHHLAKLLKVENVRKYLVKTPESPSSVRIEFKTVMSSV